MVALGFIFELCWCLQFLFSLFFTEKFHGEAVHYLFDSTTPLKIKVFSFVYHITLPILGLWWITKQNYHPKYALPNMLIIVTVIVVASRIFSTKDENINEVYFIDSPYAYLITLFIYLCFVLVMDRFLVLFFGFVFVPCPYTPYYHSNKISTK